MAKQRKEKIRKNKPTVSFTAQDHGHGPSRGRTTASLHAVVRAVEFLWCCYVLFPRPCVFRWSSNACNTTFPWYMRVSGHCKHHLSLVFSLVLRFRVLEEYFLVIFGEEHPGLGIRCLSLWNSSSAKDLGDFIILGFMLSQLNWWFLSFNTLLQFNFYIL